MPLPIFFHYYFFRERDRNIVWWEKERDRLGGKRDYRDVNFYWHTFHQHDIDTNGTILIPDGIMKTTFPLSLHLYLPFCLSLSYSIFHFLFVMDKKIWLEINSILFFTHPSYLYFFSSSFLCISPPFPLILFFCNIFLSWAICLFSYLLLFHIRYIPILCLQIMYRGFYLFFPLILFSLVLSFCLFQYFSFSSRFPLRVSVFIFLNHSLSIFDFSLGTS